MSLATRLRALADEVAVLEAAATPAPSPPPPAPGPPAPEPPPTAAAPFVARERVDLADVLVFVDFHAGSRYERFQRFAIYADGAAVLRFRRENIALGGRRLPLEVGTYTLEVDGIGAATVESAGEVEQKVTINVADHAPGWRRVQMVSPTGARSPSWFIHLGTASDGTMPACTNVYDLTHPAGSDHLWCMLPAGYAPTPRPLAPRAFAPLVTGTSPANLFRRNLAPVRSGTIHGPNVIGGVHSTFSRQAYFDIDQRAEFPRMPCIDGPRGVARTQMATHIQFGRNGSVYFLDGWAFRKMSADGTITTLAGWRHKSPPSHWAAPQELELVGDWSGIKPGFHEPWGGVWIPFTLELDENAPPINGEQPHLVGPTYLVADTQNNRIVSLEFDPRAHGVPPVCREWLTGLHDPWDIAVIGNEAFISDRAADRIVAVDLTTKAVRVVLQGRTGLAALDNVRRARRFATLDTIRAEPCVQPEGLFAHEGWLYFGSMAQGQVRRVRPDGSGLEVVCAPAIDMNSNFVKFAVAPGGTVYTQTWSVASMGYPVAHRPDGTRWNYRRAGRIHAGRGGAWESLSYGSAVAVDGHRIVFSNASEGLVEVSAALSTDPAIDLAAYVRGRTAYEALGYRLTHGEHGFGFVGYPVPRGLSPDIDVYLNAHD